MRIIGVIDLKDGQAVHARGGRRNEYSPVAEAAGTVINGDAVKLAGVYLDTFGLTDVYVADLDAITSAAPNDDVLRSICRRGGTHGYGGVAHLASASRCRAGARRNRWNEARLFRVRVHLPSHPVTLVLIFGTASP